LLYTTNIPLKTLLTAYRPGALLFNAGCNIQMFSLTSWKKNWRKSVLLFSRRTQKPHL